MIIETPIATTYIYHLFSTVGLVSLLNQGLWELGCWLTSYLYVISGVSDIQRCGHRLLPGGVGMASACSKRFVQTCNVRELWPPGLTG